MTRTIFKSESIEWETPQRLFDWISARFGPFDLDPAATDANAKTPHWITADQEDWDGNPRDGLAQDWFGYVYLNPPYGKGIDRWVRKAHNQVQDGIADRVVALLPVRADTEWWQEYVLKATAVYFIRGRVSFKREGGGVANAPFASCIVVWDRGIGLGHPRFAALDLPRDIRKGD